MTTGGHKRTRSERVAALELRPGRWERAWMSLRRRDVLARIGLALLAAITIGVVIRAWDPPFAYRAGYVPSRNIEARVSFAHEDRQATEDEKDRARSRVLYTYVQDPQPLQRLRAKLYDTVAKIVAEGDSPLWDSFQLPPDKGRLLSIPQERREQLQRFRVALSGEQSLERFQQDLQAAFAPFEKRGLLKTLPLAQTLQGGNQERILVCPVGGSEAVELRVSEARIGNGSAIRNALLAHLESPKVAHHVFNWLRPRLMATLKLKDEQATQQALAEAAERVKVMEPYEADQLLIQAGQKLDAEEEIPLLEAEYRVILANRTVGERLARATVMVGLIFGLFIVCGIYMRYYQSKLLASMKRLSTILALAVIAVALSRWASVDHWRAEIILLRRTEIIVLLLSLLRIIPLMLFGMTVAIAYRRELALLLCGVLVLVLSLAIGQGLDGFLILLGVTTTASLNMGRIRSRSKLIYVGLFSGGVAAMLTVGLGLIGDQPAGKTLLASAAGYGLGAVAAGFLMTGLLPFIERLFGVLTDLSLLELGDVAHPLLQELIRRAPSTYNHSVTVGSIAEAAAESIGARGLLVRVGAYFHDIGKMLKPGYFIENQGPGISRHEALVPAMSSLVIVAHLKDGADLARQHHLPQPIIDLIEQHHGTTLVKFFYERAAEQKQSDPNGGEVDESTYRYPGPKPQTKEAAVLMLADNVESASRTLVDPTPARIERLVRELAERRLRGGQFDESGLTLRELRNIERSIVKSLTAIYHGRLKYPDQRTA